MEMIRILSKWPFLKERIKHGFDNHKVECYHHGVRIEMKTGAVLPLNLVET
jgi:nitrite reductase/ring-hydroxylating ferredoxin subunit